MLASRVYEVVVGEQASGHWRFIMPAMHQHDRTQLSYQTALLVAQQANNDALYAAGLGRMSSLAAVIGESKEARSLLQEAQRLVTQSDAFTLRAWLAAEEAEVQADIAAQETMQNTRACFEALERAAMFASQIGSEEDTFGMYFDASRIPAYRGSCHIRLHQPQEALAALEETLEPLEPFNVDACCRRCGEIKERFLNGISHCSKSIFQHRRFVLDSCF